MNRRDFLKILSFGAGAMTLPNFLKSAKASSCKKPNIVLIMADDLGYGHLGCYGQELIRTPNLDRMAREGMRFTQTYAGSAVCAPSRSVLMTGKHGGRASVRGNSGGIPLLEEDVTVAEVLKSAGYATALFGKWGLGEHGTTGIPNKQGFDEFVGTLHQIHAHFYYPDYIWKNDSKFPLPGNINRQRKQYIHDIFVEEALNFVTTHKNDPFFVYLPFAIPHYELLVPEESLKEYRGKFPEKPYKGRGKNPGYPRDYAKQEHPKAAMAAMITHMDRNIGRLMAKLKELGLDDNTIIFFTSDNGPSGGAGAPDFFKAAGPLRGLKGSFYEGGIRVPMIVRWPGKIQPGSVSDHLWYFPDIMPTLAELAGTNSPEGIDGISVLPALLGKDAVGRKQEEHKYLYWGGGKEKKAIRMGKWKGFLTGKSDKMELYDLSKDVGETNNIADQHPDIVARIERYMEQAYIPARPQIEPKRPKGRKFV
ncbi:MAG: arylsulfatase [Planctomycetota bacterium]|jgi:arylsulfatase A-like enzyme